MTDEKVIPVTLTKDWTPPARPYSGLHAVVVLSGGQDSVTCLGWALAMFETVTAVGFDYGQKHDVEMNQAERICERYGVPFTAYNLDILSELADSALVTSGDVNEQHHRNSDLPASFVPNRNALFLTTAHAVAQKVGAQYVITGVCETDYSGYPDCRATFISSLEDTLNTGYLTNIAILTPLMYLNKADTFALADKCGFLGTVLQDSHTCYEGDRTRVHEWGRGCGKCPACQLRERGWVEYINAQT